jgi:hypothetical protein
MKIHKLVPAAVIAALMLGACTTFDVPDLNNPGLDELLTNPTRTGVLTAATGLLIGQRGNSGSQNGYISLVGVFGRESYNFDPADPRFVTELLIGPLNGASPAFGGNLWGAPYANIRNANILLGATALVTGISAPEKEGIRGFAKTIKALDLLYIIGTRDSIGAPIDVDILPTGAPAPFATRAQVYGYITALLDSAATHLGAAGTTFPFAMSLGYAGYDTPAQFLKVNRGLRARVAVYTDDFTNALVYLGQSFLNTAGPLTDGVYHSFGSGSGDALNALYDPQARAILAHPSLSTDAQLRVSGAKDLRFTSKVTTVTPAKTAQGHSSGFMFTIYNSSTASIPIIRNEELILLRAEANIGLNNLVLAQGDIDLIRTTSGGLPVYSGAVTQAALRAELLYNKRYSLMFEGHRWLDLRHYNLLNTMPLDLATDKRFNRMPVPVGECDPRSPQPAGCGTIAGF